jgi:protein SCO1/2
MNAGKLIFTFLFFLLAGMAPLMLHAQADTFQDEVGITEHLDTIVPGNLTFFNEQGQPVELQSLVGKPTILVPVYYDCPGICPAILSGVSDVIEKMGMELGKDYQVITFSFNERDDPASSVDIKKNYLRDHSRPRAEHWLFLTGDSTNIYSLTNAIGYNFTQAGFDFMHPSCILILSPERKVTRYLYGTTFLPFDVKMALIEARKGQSRPTINRVLEYCFSYDPEGRKYTLQVTKISATIIIFFAVVLFIVLMIRSSRKKSKTKNT